MKIADCPFCGGKMEVSKIHALGYVCKCGYGLPAEVEKISAHNDLCARLEQADKDKARIQELEAEVERLKKVCRFAILPATTKHCGKDSCIVCVHLVCEEEEQDGCVYNLQIDGKPHPDCIALNKKDGE